MRLSVEAVARFAGLRNYAMANLGLTRQALCCRALRALSEVNNVLLLDGMHAS